MSSTETHGVAGPRSVREGELLWTPSPERIERTRLTAFSRFAEERTGRSFDEYAALWQWSATDLGVLAGHLGLLRRPVLGSAHGCSRPAQYAGGSVVPRRAAASPNTSCGWSGRGAALLYLSEAAPLRELAWEEFTRQVRVFATWLRGRGLGPGDRVAAYLQRARGDGRDGRDREHRRGLGQRLPGLRRPRSPGSVRPAGADRSHCHRRLPLWRDATSTGAAR